MGLRVKNFNIMGVHWNIWLLGGWEFTKKQYIWGNSLKRWGLEQAKGRGAWRKKGVVFLKRVDSPMNTANYNLFGKFLMIWKNSSNIFVYLKLNFNLTIDWHNLSQFQLFGKGVEKFNSIMTYFSNLVGVSFF